MGVLKDITDVVKDLRNEVTSSEAGDYLSKKRYSSIAKQSTEGTLQFPVLVSRSLDIANAQMVSKALEREFASFVQIVLSMNPYLDLKKDKDVAGYLKNFHQNTGSVKMGLGDMTLEHCNVLANETDSIQAMFVTCEGSTGKIALENRKQLSSVLEHVRFDKVNDLYKPKDPLVRLNNGDLSQYYNNQVKPLMESKGKSRTPNMSSVARTTRGVANKLQNKMSNDMQDAYKEEEMKLKKSQFGFTKDDSDRKFNQSSLQHSQKMSLEKDKFASMNRGVKLTDNDAKKSNELVPTLLNVSLNVKEDGNFGGVINFVLGVKAVLHPVNNDEMVNNLVAGCKNSNKFFNFIRWTSGETTFFKDFLFNISEIKEDVYNRSAGSSHWWTTLKRRKSWAKMKHKFPIGKRILPNTSIVISLEEVEYIKATYGFDLMDTRFVDKLMKEYFLLTFVVVDSSLEVAHFLFDGQVDFQTTTFAGLDRENSNKTDFKEVMKLVNNNRL